MPTFPLQLPPCHIKFLRPCCLCLLSLIFPLQHSFQLMLKLRVNHLPDGHLLPSLLSKHNKSYQLRRIQEDSKYPAGLLEWLIRWTVPHTYLSCNLIFSVAVKLSLMSCTSRVSGQQTKLPHLDILPTSTDFWWSSKKFLHSLAQALDSASPLPLKKEAAPERHRRIWGEIKISQLGW